MLSSEQVQVFRERGVLGPFAAVDVQTAGRFGRHIRSAVLTRAGPNADDPCASRHLDDPRIADLSRTPSVLAAVESSSRHGTDEKLDTVNAGNSAPLAPKELSAGAGAAAVGSADRTIRDVQIVAGDGGL